jgi:hypothetical protein
MCAVSGENMNEPILLIMNAVVDIVVPKNIPRPASRAYGPGVDTIPDAIFDEYSGGLPEHTDGISVVAGVIQRVIEITTPNFAVGIADIEPHMLVASVANPQVFEPAIIGTINVNPSAIRT